MFGAAALVTITLMITGLANATTSLSHRPQRGGVGRVGLGLVVFVAALNAAGFIAAGAVLFVCVASAFGSRRWLRDGLTGVILCASVYVLFTHGLGVALPAGALWTR